MVWQERKQRARANGVFLISLTLIHFLGAQISSSFFPEMPMVSTRILLNVFKRLFKGGGYHFRANIAAKNFGFPDPSYRFHFRNDFWVLKMVPKGA